MARKHRDGTYKGVLAKPIILQVPPPFWGGVTPERIAAYHKDLSRRERANAVRVQQLQTKKLAMLFRHYRIANKKSWAALARALIAAHVPGFRIQFPEVKPKRGRKRIWDTERLVALYQTVESIKQQHRFNDRQALTFMVHNAHLAPTWGLPTGHKGSKPQWIETLEARLHDAKTLQKLCDQAERDLQTIATSMKFRK